MRQTARNARFWVYENGTWTKLTLRPGQELQHSRYRKKGRIGYENDWHYWSHVGNGVQLEWESLISDGFYVEARHGRSFCDMAELDVLPETHGLSASRALPRWHQLSYTSQQL